MAGHPEIGDVETWFEATETDAFLVLRGAGRIRDFDWTALFYGLAGELGN